MSMQGIPNDQGEQRCQAVGGNAEGKVPTTAPACASESPGSNSAAGADGAYPQRYVDALNREIADLRAEVDRLRKDYHWPCVVSDENTSLRLERSNLRVLLEELVHAAEDRLFRAPRGVGDSLEQRRRLESAVKSAKGFLGGGGGFSSAKPSDEQNRPTAEMSNCPEENL